MFWDLLDKSTITSGLIAVALIATVCYCTITQTPLPQHMGIALGTVLGYFFASKQADAQAKRIS